MDSLPASTKFTKLEWANILDFAQRARQRRRNAKVFHTRSIGKPAPRHDQLSFRVADLVVLWHPLSRATIYRLIDEAVSRGVIKESELMRITRPKIDTTKRFKREYRTAYIPRAAKEKIERMIGGLATEAVRMAGD